MIFSRCRSVQERLPLFFNGELDAAQDAAIRAHLARCPRCERHAQRLQNAFEALDDALSFDDASEFQAPPTLDARVMATVRRTPPRAAKWPHFSPLRARFAPLRVGFAIALAIGAGFAGGAMWQSRGASQTSAPMAFAQPLPPHDLSRAYQLMGNGVMVSGANETQVAQKLQRFDGAPALGSPLQIVRLNAPQARLLGGCWMEIGGRKVPSFCYSWNGKRVSIFQSLHRDATDFGAPPDASPDVSPSDTPERVATQSGAISSVIWREGARTFALVVADSPETSLALQRQVIAL